MRIDPTKLEIFKQTLPQELQKEIFCWLSHEFDIVIARYIIKEMQLPKRTINVVAWAKALSMDGPQNLEPLSFNMLTGVSDVDALKPNIEFTHPIIIAEHTWKSKGKHELSTIVIDGNHRLRKAFLQNIPSLEAYVLEKKYLKHIRH